MGRTRKPCPGCGEVDSARSSNEVCHDCKTLLREALDARERRKANPETEARKLPYAAHGLPHIHDMRDGHLGPDYGERVRKGIYALLKLIARPAGGEADYNTPGLIDGQESSYEIEVGYFPAGFGEIVNELYTNIVNGAEAAHRGGYREGQNLLAELAKGEVSIADFNKICADLERPRAHVKLKRRG